MTSHFAKSALLTLLLSIGLGGTVLLVQPAVAATATSSSPSTPESGASSRDAAAGSAPQATIDSSDADNDNDDSGNWDATRQQWRRWGNRRRFHQNGNDLVSVGHDTNLPAGQTRDSVVAIMGSATNNGTARQDVVSVLGNTTVNGPTSGSAVAVLGSVTANADIGQDVVAVLGNVYLGPNAHVHGQIVSILGTVNKDPAAIVDQGVQRVLPGNLEFAEGLRNWVGHGLMFGRPLVLGTGVGWLWGFFFAFLAVYTILALLFRDAAEHCIATLNDHPGKSLITAILAVLLTPLMFLLLAITVVGLLVIPIAIVALFCCAVFGKTTVLGWIGSRCFSVRPGHAPPHPALSVIVGGLLVMLAYLVPLLGFVIFILLGMLGYGAVLYALLHRIRQSTSSAGPSVASSAGSAPSYATSPPPPPPPPPPSPSAGPEVAPASGPAAAAYATSGADLAAEPSTPLPLTTLPRANFWPRMGALFIDAIIVWAVVRLLLDWPQEGSTRLCLLALAVYGAVMWKAKGTTVGGIACDLRVVRLDNRPVDWSTACVRALGCILSLCALGLGFFWIAFDPGKQAWHDKLAGTIVVRVPKGTPLA